MSQNDLTPVEPPSPAFVAAQAQLETLRQVFATQGQRLKTGLVSRQALTTTCDKGKSQSKPIPSLPPHLGWHGPRKQSPVRQLPNNRQALLICTANAAEPVAGAADLPQPETDQNATVKVHPALAGALLHSEQVAAGRIWLLLRHLDRKGQGWITIADARKALTNSAAPLRTCGWRQLRNLLRQGNGVFWQRTRDRIWLYSLMRVASALDIVHFKGIQVKLPVQALSGTIGIVRAHLYAVYHAGRDGQPISREAIQIQTKVAYSSQRNYEQRTKITSRPNYAILAKYDATTMAEKTWRHGHATFRFTDKHGNHGACNAQYIARQLPNSYYVKHVRPTSRNSKQLNRALKDLSPSGTTGNGKRDTCRIYFQQGKAAARAKATGHTVYWRSTQPAFWYALEPEIV